ncbi:MULTISPECIES: hypothetical protein [Nocardia]|uniref:hypothetical protein n=1 Tax=Nocardia TaxID=1817 RepID=UPI001E4DD684|nr:hypothetical protein [Nocardia asteroides]UGT61198.1 hypothetical protein LTT61_29365 [Nocardia asteroides]
MRESLFRKATACIGLAVVASAVLVGCGSDDESDAATSTKAAATTTAAPATADAATTQAITQAYTTFFDATQPADKRAAQVQSGDAFLQILQAQASNPQGQGTTVSVGAIKLVDASNADVGYSLLINGAPVLPDQTGQAVKEGSTWKVASATFCALIAIQGGTSTAC